eukprot:TRINITY_DN40879_c0_g1_i1.p1 TRINITY_DN40879_c0_g1~~TRINITY_DN40879_c0_g1_i1.p1  ORF type:complete len:400 (+),score=34.94 TRINITY_DN40879_c0_g1_i1:88-1200(+)
MPIIVDDFIDEECRSRLLGQLPPLERHCCKQLTEVWMPQELDLRMRNIVGQDIPEGSWCESVLPHVAGGAMVSLPARIACGSVPTHRDCFNPLDAADPGFINGLIAILYLSGSGSLVLSSESGDRAIDIVPGRLIAWSNSAYCHRLDAAPGGEPRAMVGPVAIDAEGYTRRAHDFWSTQDGHWMVEHKVAMTYELTDGREKVVGTMMDCQGVTRYDRPLSIGQVVFSKEWPEGAVTLGAIREEISKTLGLEGMRSLLELVRADGQLLSDPDGTSLADAFQDAHTVIYTLTEISRLDAPSFPPTAPKLHLVLTSLAGEERDIEVTVHATTKTVTEKLQADGTVGLHDSVQIFNKEGSLLEDGAALRELLTE